ncbi:GNAT family N-acetyltransferase [Victivallis sp. Marseille-Q1083]|uniref:GNAT family N-acetyltransferase n=1 Tax=Victivallis sp. Marseille-Q1083 TaxID=2717288 RepID=UPI00158C9CB3|nr:GNAT family N-acetyltransferase [Victivallis sp. Marseille-Q1083]
MPGELIFSSDPADEKAVVEGLKEFNFPYFGTHQPENGTIVARREDGSLRGGLVFCRQGRAFEVKYLWVGASERGRGLGSRLLAAAEEKARDWECRYVWLFTNSFQGPKFYPKFGYRVFATFEDTPVIGNVVYFFRKEL